MQITLENIMPVYFGEDKISRSQIWGHAITLKKGAHVHIIAPSGSGKTSLIHFMYGLRKEYKGTIRYGDEDIAQLAPERFAIARQKEISIVFQDLRLFANQTARENIELKRQLAPFHPAEKITEMAQHLGIAAKLDNPVSTCSYGEQQRIAIIRSLMQPFGFLLLDEPFSHLDDDNRSRAASLITEECSKRNASLLFADLKQSNLFPGEKILYL